MSKRFIDFIAFDLETYKDMKSTPEDSRVKTYAAAANKVRGACVNYLINNIDKPNLAIRKDKYHETCVWFGKWAARDFVEWVFKCWEKTDLIMVNHNHNYDYPLLKDEFNRQLGLIKEKDKDAIIKIQETRAKKKMVGHEITLVKGKEKRFIRFIDTLLWFNKSLARCLKDCQIKERKYIDRRVVEVPLNKGSIEYTKTDMEFHFDGSIRSYKYIKDQTPYRLEDDSIVVKENIISQDWSVEEKRKEWNYAITDVIGLIPLLVFKLRQQTLALEKCLEREVIRFNKKNKKYQALWNLKNKSTVGSTSKFIVSLMFEGSQDKEIREILDKDIDDKKSKRDQFDKLLRPILKTREDYDKERRSMIGGLTACGKFRIYHVPSNKVGVCLDVNSMYGFIIQSPLPYGEILTEKPKGVNGVDYASYWLVKPKYDEKEDKKGNIKWVPRQITWKEKYNRSSQPLGNNFFKEIKNKSEDPIYYIWDMWFTNPHVSEMINHDFRKIGVAYRKLKAVLKKPVEVFGDIKKYYNNAEKGTLEHTIRDTFKLMSNALYGKTCEKIHLDTEYYSQIQDKYLKLDEYKLENPEARDLIYRCIFTGTYITTIGRIMLSEMTKKIIDAGGEFLYCDTDSVFVVIDKNNPIINELPLHPSQEGLWKCENFFNLYLDIGKKKKYFTCYQVLHEGKLKPIYEVINKDEVIPFIKSSFPRPFWQHMINKDGSDKKPEEWKEMLKPKMATAGFDKGKIESLNLDQWKSLYDYQTRTLFIGTKRTGKTHPETKIVEISQTDAQFNIFGSTKKASTENVMWEVNGDYVFKKSSDLPLWTGDINEVRALNASTYSLGLDEEDDELTDEELEMYNAYLE